MGKKIILVGADPCKALKAQHRGGVLSLSAGLLEYAKNKEIDCDIVNTFVDTFEKKKLPSAIAIIDRVYRSIIRLFFLIKLLFLNKYDGVIIFSGSGVSFLERIIASIICRMFRVPTVFFIVSGRFINDVKSNIFTIFLSKILLKVPNFLVASGKQWINLFKRLKISSEKVVLIHSWLPPSFKFAGEPKNYDFSKPISFIFLGWVIKEKGVNEIITAIERLQVKFQFNFIFVGGGTLLDELQEKVTNLGWDKFVSFKGWISDDEVKKKLLKSSDVFVLPSYAEGFPMSLIEAMALGLPSICTDVGGISDSLHNEVNGFLIPPRQTEPLIKAMKAYLKDPSLIHKHSISAIETAKKNHDQEKNCGLVFQLLTDLKNNNL